MNAALLDAAEVIRTLKIVLDARAGTGGDRR